MNELKNRGNSDEVSERAPRVAILGTRGIPARYGGFETFAEELSVRLSSRNFEVSVYTRPHVTGLNVRDYRGVALIPLPSIRQKYLETISHTILSVIHAALIGRFDAIVVCNAANSPFVWFARLFGIPTAVNVDGIERKRAKWNALGRLWYRLGERCSVAFASRIISDAEVIRDYYQAQYGAESTVLRYGYREVFTDERGQKSRGELDLSKLKRQFSVFEELGISPGGYILYVSRLEPENHALTVIRAYNTVQNQGVPLVIVGDAPYADDYKSQLRSEAGAGVIFAGYQFDDRYFALQLGAKLYIQATEVGGTHPALVEAMGFSNCIIANDTPEHREVLHDCGVYYKKNDVASLASSIDALLDDESAMALRRMMSFDRASKTLSWDAVTAGYEKLLTEMIAP